MFCWTCATSSPIEPELSMAMMISTSARRAATSLAAQVSLGPSAVALPSGAPAKSPTAAPPDAAGPLVVPPGAKSSRLVTEHDAAEHDARMATEKSGLKEERTGMNGVRSDRGIGRTASSLRRPWDIRASTTGASESG